MQRCWGRLFLSALLLSYKRTQNDQIHSHPRRRDSKLNQNFFIWKSLFQSQHMLPFLPPGDRLVSTTSTSGYPLSTFRWEGSYMISAMHHIFCDARLSHKTEDTEGTPVQWIRWGQYDLKSERCSFKGNTWAPSLVMLSIAFPTCISTELFQI